jgi:hypothetical protein
LALRTLLSNDLKLLRLEDDIRVAEAPHQPIIWDLEIDGISFLWLRIGLDYASLASGPDQSIPAESLLNVD